MGKLLIDTANLADIKRLINSNAFAGVTTNPSLMAKEAKGDYIQRLKEIVHEFPLDLDDVHRKHLSIEVTTLDPSEMLDQARELHAEFTQQRGIDLFIKIPVMVETLPVITELEAEEIRVNATACMTAVQAKMASDAGASIVSFFFNRMIDHQVYIEKNMKIARENARSELVTFCGREDFIVPIPYPPQEMAFRLPKEAQVICGSIRTPEDVRDCLLDGADFVTVPPKIIDMIVQHPKTVEAINQFQKDIEAWQS